MKEYLMGIDIGTTACKVAVFDSKGKLCASASDQYPVYYPEEGYAEQDPEEWWMAVSNSIKCCMEEAKLKPSEIAGIGIDGQSWSAIAVDKKGEVLTRTPIWMDTRAAEICMELNNEIGKDAITKLCGNPLAATYSTGKVLWYKKYIPDVYKRIDKILQSNSFIAFKLTGVYSQDVSQGYAFHFFDNKNGKWNADMCKTMGLPVNFFPEISPCDKVIGTVNREAAARCGLMEGIPVVAGGLDAAAGALGVGVIHEKETQEFGGTSCGFSICMDSYRYDSRLVLSTHVVPGKWLLQGSSNAGGNVMRWLEMELGEYERLIGADMGKSTLEMYNDLAHKIPVGSDGLVFLPYMNGERSPIWDANAKGVYFGLDYNKTRGHLIRSAMEGVAFAERHSLDVAENAGAVVEEIRATGGSTNSYLWTQMKADILRKTVTVPDVREATAFGAALLAGVGVGMYASYDEALHNKVKIARTHKTNEDDAWRYEKNYKIYRRLYECLKDLMKEAALK